MQMGWALIHMIMVDKCPAKAGVRLCVIDPIAQEAADDTPLAGNCLVALGLAMGVLDCDTLNALPFGEAVPIVEGKEDWCAALYCLRGECVRVCG